MSEPTRIVGDKAQRSALADNAVLKGIIVKVTATGVDQTAGIAEMSLGVAAEDIAQGEYGNVQIRDVGLVLSGASFARGAELSSDANGKAIAAATGARIIGIALRAATGADKLVEVELTGPGGGNIEP